MVTPPSATWSIHPPGSFASCLYSCWFFNGWNSWREAPQLEQWLRAGMQESLSCLECHSNKRLDPRQLVPGAKSIMLLLMNYYLSETKRDPQAMKISRYAYGNNNHTVVMKKWKNSCNPYGISLVKSMAACLMARHLFTLWRFTITRWCVQVMRGWKRILGFCKLFNYWFSFSMFNKFIDGRIFIEDPRIENGNRHTSSFFVQCFSIISIWENCTWNSDDIGLIKNQKLNQSPPNSEILTPHRGTFSLYRR